MSRILIIDDDNLVRDATRILLLAKGYDVATAKDGPSGLDAVRSDRFDLAIVDLFMPGMDGLQVMKAIRQMRPDMPLIAASGFMFGSPCPQMPEFESMAAEAGAASILYKPLRPADVVAAVEGALSFSVARSSVA